MGIWKSEKISSADGLSAATVADLTDTGDTTLHYHALDRDRTNHTGNQTASTISDFDTEVSNNTTVAGKLDNLVEDLTPQLGGNLAANGHDFIDARAVSFLTTITNDVTIPADSMALGISGCKLSQNVRITIGENSILRLI